jgi:hypothetical protein
LALRTGVGVVDGVCGPQLMVKKASARQREARSEETPSLAIDEIVAECHACESLKPKAREHARARLLVGKAACARAANRSTASWR